MRGSFSEIDLSQLPAPAVVEQLDFEEILDAMVADLKARDPEFSALTESDPAFKILEVAAFREVLLRQRVNEAAQATMLAFAAGADLDQRAANYNLERQVVDPGDPDASPPIPATYETDESLRRRVQRAFEGLSTAGPTGAYVFHALSADGRVADATASSPNPGEVLVTILSAEGNGAASAELLANVEAALTSEDVRPLTDQTTVQSADIVDYSVDATLYVYPGPAQAPILEAAEAAVNEYVTDQQRLGRDIVRSAIYAALHVEGVQRVDLVEPADDVVLGAHQAGHCTSIAVEIGGADE